MVERRKQIEVQEKEILRKEKELMATVKRPAEAEAFKVQLLAEGHRYGIGMGNTGRALVWGTQVSGRALVWGTQV